MPERSSDSQLFWVSRIGLLLTTVALTYYLTWHILTSRALAARWLAPIWVIETYLLIGLAVIIASRLLTRRDTERRGTPRVPAAIPIRYATEEGQVGIGTLVDITEKGAGLLLPRMTLDATRVWIQFLWFDDRIGTQGRVIHARETDDGVRLGLELQPLHPETRGLLTNFVIPYGARGRENHRNGHRAARTQPPHLPMQVEKDGISAWAIAEDLSDQAAVLLLPGSFPKGARIRLAAWGNGAPREAEVVGWESLKKAPSGLFRVEVRHLQT
jgi:hypothetical protein